MGGKGVSITDAEVTAFSIKLQEWAKGLSPKERALLDVLVKTASQGAPGSTELPDAELEKVAGGTGFSLYTQTLGALSRIKSPGLGMDGPMEHDMCGKMPGGQNQM